MVGNYEGTAMQETRATMPVKTRRDALADHAAAMKAWASHGFPPEHPVLAPRPRCTLDLKLPGGITRTALKLLDFLLANACGADAPRCRIPIRHAGMFLAPPGGSPKTPGEVMEAVGELMATDIVWNATGADPALATTASKALEHAAREDVEQDGETCFLTFSLPHAIRAAVAEPTSFGRLDLGVVRRCRSVYGLRLVHVTSLHTYAAEKRKRPLMVRFTVPELAATLGYVRTEESLGAGLLIRDVFNARVEEDLSGLGLVGGIEVQEGGRLVQVGAHPRLVWPKRLSRGAGEITLLVHPRPGTSSKAKRAGWGLSSPRNRARADHG